MAERAVKSIQSDHAGKKARGIKESAVRLHPRFSSNDLKRGLFQRTADCVCGGGCPACQAKHSNLPVSQPTDAAEIEADIMADKVLRMSMSEPVNFSSSAKKISRKCSECEEEEKLYRKESDGVSTSFAPQIVQDVLSSGGKLLDASTRSFMEARFNYDFGDVKIHDNDLAAKSASSINALAYTSGKNIVFNSAQYEPSSEPGKRLLAHELAHVVQQGTGVAAKIQRFGDLAKLPPISCDVANTGAPPPALTFLFPTSSSSLSADQRNDIALFVASWQASGGTDTLRVDGFASTLGTDEMNWQLSCDRALSAANELRNNGVPDDLITIFAQGETNEFGAQAKNQTAHISILGAPVMPAPESQPEEPEIPDSDYSNEDCSAEDWSNKIVPADRIARRMVLNAISKLLSTEFYINSERTARYDAPQFECVSRNGLCFQYRSAGVITPEEIKQINNNCREETGYEGLDISPTSDECIRGRLETVAAPPSFTALLERYFKSPTPNVLTIANVFQTIYNKFNKGDYTLECEYDCDDALGYVYGAWSDIHLCLNTMKSGGWSNECIARTIIHEFSHYYAGTDDNAYCKNGCSFGECPDELSETDALENADSYSCFAYELFLGGY